MRLKTTKTIFTLIGAMAFNISTVHAALSNSTLANKEEINQKTMPNIARPNWWVKSKKIKSNPTSKMTAQQITNVKQEPVDNFVKLATTLNWQVMPGPTGIASQRYLLSKNGKQYELAIIRMGAGVPLGAVLQIWQQKAGLPMNFTPKHTQLKNIHDQSFQLTSLDGVNAHYFIAANKINKYTFFRFSSNESIPTSMIEEFKIKLKKSVILR